MARNSTVEERFGKLAKSFGVLLPAGRRYQRSLRLSLADQQIIDQLLYHHRDRGVWVSLSQSGLAVELGLSRPTVNGQLRRLRRSGLVATASDPRHGRPKSTLRYCLDPYLAVLAMWEGHDPFDLEVWSEGNERLLRFTEAVGWRSWTWDVDGLRAPHSPVADVLARFIDKYGGSGKLSTPPTTWAVPATRFLEEDLSAELTEVNGDLDAHQLKALVARDFRPSVRETSQPKGLGSRSGGSANDRPVVEEVSGGISKR